MTELEKIARAKLYMEKLANGINPLNDQSIPEEELINNVRLSRCFFFVADVLRQVVENGGTKPMSTGKRPKKLPPDIPVEKRAQFAYSEEPIPASEMVRRLNDLIDTDVRKKITYASVTAWLIDAGMLRLVSTPSGTQVKRPTENGMAIGISVEERTSSSGTHPVVVYNIEAQHFVIDNLDAIIALRYAQIEMQGTSWTAEQEQCLTELYEKAVPMGEIALRLKRSTSAIRSRLKLLGYELS